MHFLILGLILVGSFLGASVTISSYFRRGDDKRGAVMSPLYFYALAALLHYISM